MSIPVTSPLNFNKLEALNVRMQNLTSDPGTPNEGQYYWHSADKTVYIFDGSLWQDVMAGALAITALTGDVTATGSGSVATTVAFVGGASAANVADAVTKRHTQHTDTGTTNVTFQLNSASSGVKLKDSTGTLHVRNSADNAYANAVVEDLTVNGNLTVSGTTTTLNTTTMETGDNIVLLNSEITTSAGNANAGFAVKRLHTDNSTRRDVSIIYDETADRWTGDINPSTGSAVTTKTIVQKHTETVGDGVTTSFVVTHGLNTKAAYVAVHEAGSPYAQVLADVEMTTAGTCTVAFAVAPSTNQYTITVIG